MAQAPINPVPVDDDVPAAAAGQSIHPAVTTWVVLHGDGGPVSAFVVEPGVAVTSGRSGFETFDDPATAIARLKELDPNYSVGQDNLAPSGMVALTDADGDPVLVGGKMAWVRAENGVVELEAWDADGDYPIWTAVSDGGQSWLHISDRQGRPDEVFDIAAGTGDWVPLPAGFLPPSD